MVRDLVAVKKKQRPGSWFRSGNTLIWPRGGTWSLWKSNLNKMRNRLTKNRDQLNVYKSAWWPCSDRWNSSDTSPQTNSKAREFRNAVRTRRNQQLLRSQAAALGYVAIKKHDCNEVNWPGNCSTRCPKTHWLTLVYHWSSLDYLPVKSGSGRLWFKSTYMKHTFKQCPADCWEIWLSVSVRGSVSTDGTC